MDNIKRRFESESKTRINLVGPSKCGKSTLALKLIKDGIFDYSICNDKNIDDFCSMSIVEAKDFVEHLVLTEKEQKIAYQKENDMTFGSPQSDCCGDYCI